MNAFSLPGILAGVLSGGGTPTPTPTPTIIYDSDAEEFQITANPGTVRQWYDAITDDPIAGETGTTLADADLPVGVWLVYVQVDGIADSNLAAKPPVAPLTYYDVDFADVTDGTYLSGIAYEPSYLGSVTPLARPALYSERLATTGNTHSSTTLDNLASTTGVAKGDLVTGSGIPDGTIVNSVDSSTAVTLSAAATATASGVAITFSRPTFGYVGYNDLPGTPIHDVCVVDSGFIKVSTHADLHSSSYYQPTVGSGGNLVSWTVDLAVLGDTGADAAVFCIVGKSNSEDTDETALLLRINQTHVILTRSNYSDNGSQQIPHDGVGIATFSTITDWSLETTRVFLNGNPLVSAGTYDQATGWDINGASGAPLTESGTRPGVRPSLGASIPVDVKFWKSFEVQAIPDYPFTLYSSAFNAPYGSDPTTCDMAFTYGAGPTAVHWALCNEDGALLTALAPLTLTGSPQAINGIDVQAYADMSLFMAIYDDADAASFNILSLGIVPIYPAIAPMVLGMNQSIYGVYGVTDVVNDRGMVNAWGQSPTHDPAPLNADRNPTGALTGSNTALELPLYLNNAGTQSHRAGRFDLTWPVGMTASLVASENITVGSIDNVTGTGYFTVDDETSSTNLVLLLDPNGLTPAGGVVVTCLPHTDPNPAFLYTPQYMTDYGASANAAGKQVLVRTMHNSDTESASLTINPPRFYNMTKLGEAMTAMGISPYNTLPWSADDASNAGYMEAQFAELETTLDEDLDVYVEGANEIWNKIGDYQNQYLGAFYLTCVKGYVPGVSAGAMTYANAALVNPETGETLVGFSSGEKIVALSNYNVVLVTALHDTSPGAVIEETTNSDFAVIKNEIDILPYRPRWQSDWQSAITDAGRAVFGDRFKSVLGCFTNDTADQVMARLSWNDNYKNIDYWAIAPYIGQYRDYDAGGYDQYYITDQALYLDGLFADLTDLADALVDQCAALNIAVYRALVALPAYVPSEALPEVITYETGIGFGYNNASIPDVSAMETALTAAMTDARWKGVLDHFNTRWKNEVGGPVTLITDYQAFPVRTFNQLQCFGFKDNPLGEDAADQQAYLSFAGFS